MSSRNMRFSIAITAMLALAGCGGVPLSTMWHFRNFGPKQLMQVDPSLIRAAVQFKSGVMLRNVNDNNATLHVRMKFADQPATNYDFPLAVIKQGPSVGDNVGKAEAGKHWYLFKLSPKGVRAFHDLQKDIGRHMGSAGKLKKKGTTNVTVNSGKLDMTDAAKQRIRKAEQLFIQIRLQLSPRDGFYTLYSGNVHMNWSDLKSQNSAASKEKE